MRKRKFRQNARMQWILVWVTFFTVTLLPSTCVVLRPVVCTSTLFLWTVRKPLSRHWDRRYWLLISVHCWPESSDITICLLSLSPGLATSGPLLPVAGDCGAPDNARGWHGPMVSRHTTKAATTLNLKQFDVRHWKGCLGPQLAQNIVHEAYLRIYWINKKNLSGEGWHGHCSHLGPRPPSVSKAGYRLQQAMEMFRGECSLCLSFKIVFAYLFCPCISF